MDSSPETNIANQDSLQQILKKAVAPPKEIGDIAQPSTGAVRFFNGVLSKIKPTE